MNLTVAFTAFGLVGAVIGLFISVPLKRWWHNRRHHGMVRVYGIGTKAGEVEPHYGRPAGNVIAWVTNDGTRMDTPISYGAGYQEGDRRAYLVDLSSNTQLFIDKDGATQRPSREYVHGVLKGGLVNEIDNIQNGKKDARDRRLVVMTAAVGIIAVIGFIITIVLINGIETAPHTVGNVVRP